jgi:hypothetical protein
MPSATASANSESCSSFIITTNSNDKHYFFGLAIEIRSSQSEATIYGPTLKFRGKFGGWREEVFEGAFAIGGRGRAP